MNPVQAAMNAETAGEAHLAATAAPFGADRPLAGPFEEQPEQQPREQPTEQPTEQPDDVALLTGPEDRSGVPAIVGQLQQSSGNAALAQDLFPLMASLLVHVLAVDRQLAREAMTRRSR